jgi:hypothetical protein
MDVSGKRVLLIYAVLIKLCKFEMIKERLDQSVARESLSDEQ